MSEQRVVVTGMGIVSPLGNNLADFWAGISGGRCGVGLITRFDTADFKVKVAAEVRDLNPSTYMERGEIRKTDLYAQYALGAAAEAMESSGIAGTVAPERLGVYMGSGIGGIQTMTQEHDKLRDRGPSRVSPFFVPMMIGNMAAGLIAMRYGALGPCLSVVTACSTSANAIGEAFRAIRHGYADAILAGGAEAAIEPLSIAGFTTCMALSTCADPARASIPFDARRDGFVMGEGAGAVMLESFEHAKARNATIYAEVLGYGHTCDAHQMTAPHPEGLGSRQAIVAALEQAGGCPAERLYINAHGTSTPLNDKIETLAIKGALGEAARDAFVSSTKSMTGHMLGAAGAAEAIASILALRNNLIPPTVGYREADPDCDLNITPNQAVSAPLTLALSNSMGFGGHNVCLAFGKG